MRRQELTKRRPIGMPRETHSTVILKMRSLEAFSNSGHRADWHSVAPRRLASYEQATQRPEGAARAAIHGACIEARDGIRQRMGRTRVRLEQMERLQRAGHDSFGGLRRGHLSVLVDGVLEGGARIRASRDLPPRPN